MLDMIEHSYIAVLLLILFFLLRLCEYLDYLLFQEEVLNYRWLKEEFIKNGFIGISKVIKSLTKSSIFFCSTFKNFNFLILFCSLFHMSSFISWIWFMSILSMYELYLIIFSALSHSLQASFAFLQKKEDSQHRIKDIFCLKNRIPFLLYFYLWYLDTLSRCKSTPWIYKYLSGFSLSFALVIHSSAVNISKSLSSKISKGSQLSKRFLLEKINLSLF